MRLLVFLAILTIGYGTLWYVDPVTADVKKGDAIFESITVGGVDVGKAVYAVGSIQQSILTEAQFQGQMGTDWVAMKGQALGSQGSSGYKICDDYAICTLPDATSLFLRNSDASSALGLAKVDDTTAKNGLSNAPSAVSGVAGTNVASTSVTVAGTNVKSDVTGGTISRATASTAAGQTMLSPANGYTGLNNLPHTHGLHAQSPATGFGGGAVAASNGTGTGFYPSEITNNNTDHSHDMSHTHNSSLVTGGSWSHGGTREAAAQVWSQSGTSSAAAQVWSQSGTGTAAAQGWSQSGTGTAAAQTITGDGETAPDHIVVNTFVKIN